MIIDSNKSSSNRVNPKSSSPIVEKTTTTFASKIKSYLQTFIDDKRRCRLALIIVSVLVLLASIGIAIGIPVSNNIKSRNSSHALSPAASPPPVLPNDSCYDAITVKNGTYRLDSVVGAQNELSRHIDTSCGASGYSKGVWYQYLGTDRFTTFDTCASATNFETELRLFAGSCRSTTCWAMAPLSCGPNKSGYRLVWFAPAGEMFYILVSGYDGAEGQFGLTVSC